MVSRNGCVYSGSTRASPARCTTRRSRTARPDVVSRAIGRGYAWCRAAIPASSTPRMAASRELTGLGQEHGAVGGVAESARVLDDRVEDRLLVGRRARDHAQDLAGRRLLLQRLGEVGVLGLQLGEQPRVLDGDGRLVGEGLHAARSGCRVNGRTSSPVDDDDAEQLVAPEHRERQHGPDRLDLRHPVRCTRGRPGHRECGPFAARGRPAPHRCAVPGGWGSVRRTP